MGIHPDPDFAILLLSLPKYLMLERVWGFGSGGLVELPTFLVNAPICEYLVLQEICKDKSMETDVEGRHTLHAAMLQLHNSL